MGATARKLPASFMYEPSAPPTIPAGMTIADWRRQLPRDPRRRRLRKGHR